MTFFDFFKVVGKSILFTIFFVFGADFCDFWLLAVPERCPGDNGGAGVGVQSVMLCFPGVRRGRDRNFRVLLEPYGGDSTVLEDP